MTRAPDPASPQRVTLRRLVYAGAERLPRTLTGRSMTAATVVQVLDALLAEDVPAWAAGGWGVDALLGEQSRRHADLDVVIDESSRDVAAAVDRAMHGVGFDRKGTMRSIQPMPTVWVYRSSAGGCVEILPVDLERWPFRVDGALTSGTVEGRRVPCLAATTQLDLRRGYPLRAHDRRDINRLCSRFGLPLPGPH